MDTQIRSSQKSIKDRPEVSVIVVNWNTRDILRDCLASILAQTRASHEVIVIDNASSDRSVEMVRDKFPDVRLIANTENRGFASANNQGLEIAQGKYVLLLNPDTIVLEGAIDQMLDWLAHHPDVGCVGCQVRESLSVIQQTCFADPTPLNLTIVELGLHRLGHHVPFLGRPFYRGWDRSTEREVDVVSGMFMLVPRTVLDVVGPLDPDYFIYAEEADWCRRIRIAGWTCVFAPKAQILHLDGGSKSTAQIRSRMYVQMQKSHLIYARKHHGPVGYWVVKSLFVSSALARRVVFGVLAALRGDETSRARVRLSSAALSWHLSGREPQS